MPRAACPVPRAPCRVPRASAVGSALTSYHVGRRRGLQRRPGLQRLRGQRRRGGIGPRWDGPGRDSAAIVEGTCVGNPPRSVPRFAYPWKLPAAARARRAALQVLGEGREARREQAGRRARAGAGESGGAGQGAASGSARPPGARTRAARGVLRRGVGQHALVARCVLDDHRGEGGHNVMFQGHLQDCFRDFPLGGSGRGQAPAAQK